MEEDIFIVESFLKNKEMLLKHPCWVSEKTIQAIENLINKYKELEADIYSANCIINEYIESDKEQEKIIELMKEYIFKEYISPEICSKHTAEDCYADIYDENACRECIIDYFKKKAREENETN